MLETTPSAQSSLLTRTIQREIEQESPVRAVLIFGPRRIGKTTLLRQIIGQNGCRWFNGDIEGSATDLRFQSQGDVFNVLSQASNIVIDEAHKIADIGKIRAVSTSPAHRLSICQHLRNQHLAASSHARCGRFRFTNSLSESPGAR